MKDQSAGDVKVVWRKQEMREEARNEGGKFLQRRNGLTVERQKGLRRRQRLGT